MKRLLIRQISIYSISVIFLIITSISCINQEKEIDDVTTNTSRNTISKVDFNLIDSLNESNKENINLSTIAFNRTKGIEKVQLLLKVKKDYQNIDFELKKLTEKNLIIIPKLAYHSKINPDSLKGEKANLYIIDLLKAGILNQIHLFENIEKKSQNIDFIVFATQSKKILQSNNDALKNL